MFIWAVCLTVAAYAAMKVVDKMAHGWDEDKAANWRTRTFASFVVILLATVLVGVGSLLGLAL